LSRKPVWGTIDSSGLLLQVGFLSGLGEYMAETNKSPRVLKTAPTIRERAAEAQEKIDNPKVGRVKAVLSSPVRLAKSVKIPSSPITRVLGKVLGALGKVIGWLVPRYFINSWREMKQVTWPDRKETKRLTLAVFMFAVVFGAVAAIVDKGLDEIFKKTVLK
jgi:preprotein translocase SecE subunit